MNRATAIARTRTFARDIGERLDTSYGATFAVGRDLERRLRLELLGEIGVSPYAGEDMSREPLPRLGGRVQVALTAHVGA